ncbi:MAG: hypothetical protein ACKOFW_05435 [Planctomycetaceae bacterium]
MPRGPRRRGGRRSAWRRGRRGHRLRNGRGGAGAAPRSVRCGRGCRRCRAGDHPRLARLINLNFDTRRSICDLTPAHVQMIEAARAAGASAKYCGSGGAIVGTLPDPRAYEQLRENLGRLNCAVFRPTLVPSLVADE